MTDLLQDRVSIVFGNRRNEVIGNATINTKKQDCEKSCVMSDTHYVCRQDRNAKACAARFRLEHATQVQVIGVTHVGGKITNFPLFISCILLEAYPGTATGTERTEPARWSCTPPVLEHWWSHMQGSTVATSALSARSAPAGA